jgi:hypothetical protein
MDRAMLEAHLAQAERHVIEGESHIVRQRQIISRLARGTGNLKLAEETLARLEFTQASHIAERNRLRAELAAMK